MSDVLDFVPDDELEYIDADTARLITAVVDSENWGDDPAGDDEYERAEQ